MRITVFGASGGVGREFVSQAEVRFHRVRAIYRPGSEIKTSARIEHHLLDNFADPAALISAIRDSDAVISCLGPKRTNPHNPWSRILSPLDLMERFSAALVSAMEAADGGKRFVAVSAAGVGTSREALHPVLKWVFDHSNVGKGYRDLSAMEAIISSSNLDYTVVRPVTLTNGSFTGNVRFCEKYGLTSTISRADVAGFLLRCVEEQETVPMRTPLICS